MLMKNMERKRCKKRRSNPPLHRNPKVGTDLHLPVDTTSHPRPVVARPLTSDSDSEYGSRSKKKKKARSSGDEIRVSSRGGKIPNYVDDVQDFGQFDAEDDGNDSGYYADPNVQYKEEDEIEVVLNHSRDEGRESDPEDLWFDNIVRLPT